MPNVFKRLVSVTTQQTERIQKTTSEPKDPTPAVGLQSEQQQQPEDDEAKLQRYVRSQKPFFSPSIVVFGSQDIGKQCFLVRLVNHVYTTAYDPTGSPYHHRRMKLFDHWLDASFTSVSIDPSGNPTYEYVTDSDHRFIVFAYNVSSQKSFDDMQIMYEQTLGTARPTSADPPPWKGALVVALASDLISKNMSVVSIEDGSAFARSKSLPFLETSARTGHGCEEADLVWLVKNLLFKAATHELSK